ncbi:hypothetical protein V6Z11_D01G098100 [Gossypium hirsutum]
MNYAVFVGSSVINLEVDKDKWISKSNSSRNESNLSMKRGMRRKRVLRSCNSKSVRRSSSLTPILQMQRNTSAGRMKLQNS